MKKSLIQKCNQVDDMYEMLAIYEQKVPTADQVKHDDLKEALNNFVEELRLGKEFLADHKVSQIDALQAEINEVNEELMATLRLLHSGMFTDSASSPEEASGELKSILTKIEGIKSVSETYKEFQQVSISLSIFIPTFASLSLPSLHMLYGSYKSAADVY